MTEMPFETGSSARHERQIRDKPNSHDLWSTDRRHHPRNHRHVVLAAVAPADVMGADHSDGYVLGGGCPLFDQNVAVDIAQQSLAAERHGDIHFLANDFQRRRDAKFAARP